MAHTPRHNSQEPPILPDGGRLPFAPFAECLVAPVRLALLELALELELPEIIASGGSLSAIAEKLGVSRHTALGHILDAMASAGLLHKADGVYRNTALTNAYLRKEKSAYLGELLSSLKAKQHRNIHRMKDFLFADCPVPEAGRSLHDEEHWQDSAKGLAAYQKAGVAETMAQIAASLPGAEQFHSMLELGCGPGVTALAIAKRLPKLHLSLCDFPQMLRLAEKEAQDAGMAERVAFLPGNYNRLNLGTGHDLVWACQSLYYAENLCAFLQQILCSLRPGGFFVSIHEGVRCEATEPALLTLSRLSLALEGQDVSFAEGCINHAAEKAGFNRVHRERLPMLFGDADLEVFRKPPNAENCS